jgi:hypothetical protein
MTRFTVVVLAIATVVAALLASTGADLSASPSMFFPTASYIYVYIRRFCIIIQGADEVTGYAYAGYAEKPVLPHSTPAGEVCGPLVEIPAKRTCRDWCREKGFKFRRITEKYCCWFPRVSRLPLGSPMD